MYFYEDRSRFLSYLRKWFMGTLVFSTLHCRDFSFFLFLIFFSSRAQKKYQNANKRISHYFPLRCFLSAFFVFVAYLRFVLLLGCVFVLLVLLVLFWGFFVRAKSFRKKIKSLKLP